MPKVKTNRGAKKRFSATGAHGIKRAKMGRRHILTTKDRKRKRKLRKAALVNPANEKSIRRLLPYL